MEDVSRYTPPISLDPQANTYMIANHISETKAARDGTPIAVLSIPDPSHRIIHLYYVDITNVLQRGRRVNETWTFGFAVAQNISPESDITAVWDANHKMVQLFIQTDDSGDEIIQVADDPASQP